MFRFHYVKLGLLKTGLIQVSTFQDHVNDMVLNVDEDFVIFLTSKLITCLTDGLGLGMKFQSTTYLLGRIEHIYWILDLAGEVYSIWIL